MKEETSYLLHILDCLQKTPNEKREGLNHSKAMMHFGYRNLMLSSHQDVSVRVPVWSVCLPMMEDFGNVGGGSKFWVAKMDALLKSRGSGYGVL